MIGSPRLSYHEGDHVCILFSSPEEQLQAAVEYIRGGLSRGERCLWISCERPVADFRAGLKLAGIDVKAEETRGALLLLAKHEGHLKGGSFDPDRVIAMLHQAVKDALDDGFTGLCAGGDMNWLLDEAPGSERIAEYEARLNHFYASNHALGLCTYNVRTMPPAILDHCLATHRTVCVEGPILMENPFYELPEKAMSRIARPQDIDRKIREFRSRDLS
jgi:chemotaxis family two-component system sensor kinase Cph1